MWINRINLNVDMQEDNHSLFGMQTRARVKQAGNEMKKVAIEL